MDGVVFDQSLTLPSGAGIWEKADGRWFFGSESNTGGSRWAKFQIHGYGPYLARWWCHFHPENWGRWTHFDSYSSDGLKPPTIASIHGTIHGVRSWLSTRWLSCGFKDYDAERSSGWKNGFKYVLYFHLETIWKMNPFWQIFFFLKVLKPRKRPF